MTVQMPDLELDFDALRDLVARSRTLAAHLSDARSIAEETARATGHGDLASRVREFGSAWDVNRERLRGGLQHIGDYVDAVVDTFGELDDRLTSAAEGAP